MPRAGRILIVDDEVNARGVLAELLRDDGYEVETAAAALAALAIYEAFAPHAVITDLRMPGMDGIELVKKVCAHNLPAAVIVMTASSEVQTAVDAMRAGAADYLTKPINFDELRVVLDKVLETERLRRETRQLRARVGARVAPSNIIGTAPAMQRVLEIIDQVAPTRATVLITGETGTGKDLVANAIHQRSPRASGPFIKLHCAGLAGSLLESELFGHERGAFSGALTRKDGRLSLADGGTLFLDEIAEISPAIQVKLLRFLQDREIERAGGTRTLRLDVRIIAASTCNLSDEVARGRFRKDLFYRLSVVTLELPPLRERRSDIPVLARLFLERCARDKARGKARDKARDKDRANDPPLDGFTPEARDLLAGHDWPGNVRELENTIERAVVLATGSWIEPRHLAPTVRPSPAAGTTRLPVIPGATMAELERYAITETLKATGGSTSKAADVLGISTRTIQYRLHQYNQARSDLDVGRRTGSGTMTKP